MNLDEVTHVHFIGIGGIGMSALARLFLKEGTRVSGSDAASSRITNALAEAGVEMFRSQARENIGDTIDLVIYTEAMTEDHEEMVAARALGVPMVNYFEALGVVANDYYLIAVSGTHGKTTTTAMIVDILEEAGYDPSAVVGSLRAKTKSNYRAGKSKYFVVEACEYKRDFLHLKPDVLVITNLEHEHVDYYTDLADVQSAFRELAEKVPEEGVVIAETADGNVAPVLEGLLCKVVDYTQFLDLALALTQPGIHNRMNAAAASAAAAFIGVEKAAIDTALQNFAGTWRRFEYKGEVNGAPVYDDYGHHPTEIAATVAATREKYPDKKVTVIFQPHTYSRTETLFDDFVSALGKADRAIVVPIYAARKEEASAVSSEGLAEAITHGGGNALYVPTLEDVAREIRGSVSESDVVLVMGAGNVTELGDTLTR